MQKIKQFFSNPIFWCFGVIGGLMLTLTKAVFPVLLRETNGSRDYSYSLFNIENLIIFTIFTLLFYIAIGFIHKGISKIKLFATKKNRLQARKVFLATFCISLMVFLIAFLVYHPGLGMNDTHSALKRFVVDNQQPPIFQALVYGVFHLIKGITGSGNAGYATLSVLQFLAASGIIAYFISWLYSHKIVNWILVLAGILLIGSPLISDYTVTVLKDTWFAYAFLLLLPNLFDFVFCKKPTITNKILLIVSLLGIWVSRTNGPMIVIILSASLLIMFFKDKTKRILLIVSTGAFLLTGFCVNQAVSSRITQDSSFRESVSIPLAQIGAVVESKGNLSEEDRAFIEKILPIEKWDSNYRFSFVDLTKFDEDFDNIYLQDHKQEFIKTWLSIVSKNPSVSMRTYLFQTYGLWNLAYWDTNDMIMNQSLFQSVLNNIAKDDYKSEWNEWLKTAELSNQPLLSPELSETLDDYYQTTSTTNMYLNAGIIILICLGCVAIIIVSKKYIYLILFLPIFLTWGSMMIATPASMIYRYNFYLLLALPFIIITTINASQSRKQQRAISR